MEQVYLTMLANLLQDNHWFYYVLSQEALKAETIFSIGVDMNIVLLSSYFPQIEFKKV
jgi:hypothetical protein